MKSELIHYQSQDLVLCSYLEYEGFKHLHIENTGIKNTLVYKRTPELEKAVSTYFSGAIAPIQAVFVHYFNLLRLVKNNNRNGGLWK